jgi:hypothetical protein
MVVSEWNVYEQKMPIRKGDIFIANLVLIGQVQATTGAQAIQAGREAYLIRWPVVEKTQ